MMQRWIILSLVWFTSAALAESTPAGLWRTIDDHSGKEKTRRSEGPAGAKRNAVITMHYRLREVKPGLESRQVHGSAFVIPLQFVALRNV